MYNLRKKAAPRGGMDLSLVVEEKHIKKWNKVSGDLGGGDLIQLNFLLLKRN